jgi:sugar lactone lactonase YvrE
MTTICRWLAQTLLLLLAAGCATQPPVKKSYLFYPPPPDEPRLQYLTGFSADSEVFGNTGFKKFIVGDAAARQVVGKPYGIASRQGKVYVCDSTLPGIILFDFQQGALVRVTPPGQGKMRVPINAALDSQGGLYVTDTGRQQVLMYGPDLAYLGALGKENEMKPCGIAVQGDKLYVTDLKNHQVRVYRLSNRELIQTLPKNPADPKAKLFSPTNVSVDKDGQVYVVDTGGFRVQIYSPEGELIRSLGGQGTGLGKFARPKGISVDREGRFYVVDAATQSIQLFDPQGHLLMYFGDPSIPGGPGATSLPAGVAVDYESASYFQKYAAPGYKIEYVIFMTNQYCDPKVAVYGFLSKQ